MPVPSSPAGLEWIAGWVANRKELDNCQLLLVPGAKAADLNSAAWGQLQALEALCAAAKQYAGQYKGRGTATLDIFMLTIAQQGAAVECWNPFDDVAAILPVYCKYGNTTDICFLDAVHGDQPAAVAWLLALGFLSQEIQRDAASIAAQCGYAEVLEVLHDEDPALLHLRSSQDCTNFEEDPELNELNCLLNGNSSADVWLGTRDATVAQDSKWTCPALSSGNPPTHQHLRSYGSLCPWGFDCTYEPASTSSPAILRDLHRQDPHLPWDSSCADAAAMHGNLEVLEWLRIQGCTISCSAYHVAISQGQYQAVAWLRKAAVPYPIEPPLRLPSSKVVPALMLYADLGTMLTPTQLVLLRQAQQVFCTFHGLLRWGQRIFGRPADRNGKAGLHDPKHSLLIEFCSLPQELITKIAVLAELQHDILLHSLPQIDQRV